MLGPSIASSKDVAIVLYSDLTRLCGARFEAAVMEAVMSELSGSPLVFDLLEKND